MANTYRKAILHIMDMLMKPQLRYMDIYREISLSTMDTYSNSNQI